MIKPKKSPKFSRKTQKLGAPAEGVPYISQNLQGIFSENFRPGGIPKYYPLFNYHLLLSCNAIFECIFANLDFNSTQIE